MAHEPAPAPAGAPAETPSGAAAQAPADALDDLDRALLRLLREDARRSHRELARRTGSTQPTVTARVRRMEDAGIIRGYVVVLDEDAFAGDIDAAAAVACHWCRRRTGAPVWEVVGGRRHPFCCTTCRGAYQARHEALAQGL